MPDEDKILSFDLLKNTDDAPHFDRDSLLKLLQEIPNNIISEYVIEVFKYLDELVLFNNIFSSIDSPNLCRYHLDKLNQDQLDKIGKLATCLASNDVLNQIQKILSIGLRVEMPTAETKTKANELITCIKIANINHKKAALELIQLSISLKLLSELFLIFGTFEISEGCLFERIAKLNDADIDALIELAKNPDLKSFG
jgi:hypothetical protein